MVLVDFGGGAVGEGAEEALPIAQGIGVVEGDKVAVAEATAGVFAFLVLCKTRSDGSSRWVCKVSVDGEGVGGDAAQSESEEVVLWRAEHREFHGNGKRIEDSGRSVVVGVSFGHKELHGRAVFGEDQGAIVDGIGGIEKALENRKDRVEGSFGGITIADEIIDHGGDLDGVFGFVFAQKHSDKQGPGSRKESGRDFVFKSQKQRPDQAALAVAHKPDPLGVDAQVVSVVGKCEGLHQANQPMIIERGLTDVIAGGGEIEGVKE